MRKRTIGVLSFSATIILGFALASMYVKPNDKDVLSLFGLIFPYVFLFGLIVIPLAYKSHRITFILGLCLLCFGLKPFLSYVKPTFSRPNGQTKGNQLHVMTYNAMLGTKMVNKSHVFTGERQELFNELMNRAPKPDVVCVQEASSIVKQALHISLEYQYVHEINMRAAIIHSKYPIVQRGQVDFGQKVNSCLWADIVPSEGDTIRIYSVHLESNRLSQSSYEFLEEEEYEPQKAIDGIKDLITKYPIYAGKRAEQALLVKKHINECPFPVIVCGDLNDPPMSFTYRTLKKDLNDTFLSKGGGFGTTWVGAIPMLRIDYIFASRELKNTGFYCLESDLSDHYPVKASFNLN